MPRKCVIFGGATVVAIQNRDIKPTAVWKAERRFAKEQLRAQCSEQWQAARKEAARAFKLERWADAGRL